MNRAILLLLFALAAGAAAQKPVPKLYPAPDLLIPARQINLAGNGGVNATGSMYVGPDGRMLYSMNYYGDLRFFDSLGKTMPFKVPLAERDGDIGWMENAGWTGSTFWINDTRFQQVALLDANGKLVRTIPNPSWVHPHWADRRRYPLFASMMVLAVYADGSMLVRPGRPRTLLDTPGFDKTATHLMRVDKDGAIERHIATFTDDDGGLWLRSGARAEHIMQPPVVSRSFWRVSADGKRIVFVKPGATEAESGHFRVTALDERGDTLFNRTYDMPAVRVDKKSVDSALAAVQAFGDQTADEIRTKLRAKIPAFRSFVTGLLAGRDGSTWVLLRPVSDADKTRTALILDERGEPIANVVLPEVVQPVVVDRTRLWGTDRTKPGIVRMKLQSTPPPS
jgi:hypothetical protein